MFINELYSSFSLHPYISIIGGLIIGSFLNVIIWIYPKKLQQSSATNNNASNKHKILKNVQPIYPCLDCNKKIRWYNNIPLLSYLNSKSACRNCFPPINHRYPLIEVITSILFLFATLIWSDNYCSLAVIYLSLLLITTTMLDFNYQILPYSFIQNILWSGIIFAWIGISPISLSTSINGVTVGFISFYIIQVITSFLMRRQIFKMGDVILFAGLGAWIGVFALPYLALTASIVGIFYIMITNRIPQRITFSPCLTISGLAIVYVQGFISF